MFNKVVIITFISLNFCLSFFADEKVKFAHEKYYVDPYPKAKFKVLPNGMRYILIPNDSSQGWFVGLYVAAGSAQEKPDQLGIAHLIEHLAFNGTENATNYEINKFIQANDLSLGCGANAFTGHNKTFYYFDLSSINTNRKLITSSGNANYYESSLTVFDKCIKILSGFASNILFEQNSIDKEKEIILSEKRFRENALVLINNQFYAFAFPELPSMKNLVIGSKESIKNFNKDLCIEYYNRNYTPDNLVLIVAGIINKHNIKDIEKSINNYFGNIKSKKTETYVQSELKLMHQGIKVNYVYDSDIHFTNVQIGTLQKIMEPTNSFIDLNKKDIAKLATKFIVHRRLIKNLILNNSKILNFTYREEKFIDQYQLNTFSISCEPENWDYAVNLLNFEIQRILTNGFLESELKEFRENYRSILSTDIKDDNDASNSEYAFAVLDSLIDNKPYLNAKQTLKWLEPFIITLNKEDLLKEFKKSWNVDHRLIQVMGNVILDQPEISIQNALDLKIEHLDLGKQDSSNNIVKFPYEKRPLKSAEIIKDESSYQFNTHRVIFKNNVVINALDTKKNNERIFLRINMGNGDLALPKGKEAMSRLAHFAINYGGLEKLTEAELADQLTGKSCRVTFDVGANCFSFICETTRKDLETTLQLCREKLLHPGYRPEAEQIMKKVLSSKYAVLKSDINSHFKNKFDMLIYRNSLTNHWPDREILDGVKFDDIKSWLSEQLKDCSIEINAVGDLDLVHLKKLVGAYFGTLSKRQEIKMPQLSDYSIKEKFEVVETFPSKTNRSIVSWVFPTVDAKRANELYRIDALQCILQEKLRIELREKLKLTYTPMVSHEVNSSYLNNCYLLVVVDIATEDIDKTQKALEDIIKDLQENGFANVDMTTINKQNAKRFETVDGVMKYLLEFSSADKEKMIRLQEYYKTQSSASYNEILACIKKYLDLNKKCVYILKSESKQKNE